MPLVDASFPEVLAPLFKPKRYKVLYGGRGAGRSWGVARALLLLGTERPIRVLCAREFQNSITDSVHKLLSDQIELLGLSGFYDIQQAKIFGANGTTISFEGIKNNVSRIKSYEGVDYCWVEEAVKVSRASWGVLIPTIRKNGSEIWMTFNPELETDYTYSTFVKEVASDPATQVAGGTMENASTVVVKMTYKDNPFFPATLLKEVEADRKRDHDYYLNVWEGHCLQMLEGVVFAKEIREATEENRIARVPWDRSLPVSIALDLGKKDMTSIWFFQRVAMQWRVIDFYQNNQEEIPHYAKVLEKRNYTYDEIWLPHDGFAKRLGTKLSIEEQFKAHFPNARVRQVPNLSLTDGINAARTMFSQFWFDEAKCQEGLDSLRRYRYKVTEGQFSDKPQHDDASHAADALRYMTLAMTGKRSKKGDSLSRLEKAGEVARAAWQKTAGMGNSGLGWLK